MVGGAVAQSKATTGEGAALAFHRDVLGLEVRMDVPQGDFRWVTVGAPRSPTSASS